MDLNDMKTGITRDELMTRIDTARRVMRENDLSVMIIVKRTLEGYDSWFNPNVAHDTVCRIHLEFFDTYLKKTKEEPSFESNDVVTFTEYEPVKPHVE